MRIPFMNRFSPKSTSTESDLERDAVNGSKPPSRPTFPAGPPLDPSAMPPKLVKFQHTLSSYVVNVCFLMQIIVGAALTALGAANGPSAAVTILGALNTIIAGLLTYLKGQGLPGRLEQYLHLLRTLREHIEEREREFSEPDCLLDVDDEVTRITRMYQEVRQTAEDNAPGNVLPPRGVITSLLKKPDINRSEQPPPKGDRTDASMMAGMKDLKNMYSEHQHLGTTGLEENRSGIGGRLSDLKDMYSSHQQGASTGMDKEKQSGVAAMGGSLKDLRDMYSSHRAETEAGLEEKQSGIAEAGERVKEAGKEISRLAGSAKDTIEKLRQEEKEDD